MIIVTEVKYIETEKDTQTYKVRHYQDSPLTVPCDPFKQNDFAYRDEIVNSFELCDPYNGKRYTIGLTANADNFFKSVLLRSYNDILKESKEIRDENYKLNSLCTERLKVIEKHSLDLTRISLANFFTRLKWLFTGVKIQNNK